MSILDRLTRRENAIFGLGLLGLYLATRRGSADEGGGDGDVTVEFTLSLDGRTVTAESLAVDPSGPIRSYSWDWGDGGASTGQTATHTYQIDGEYLVTHTVVDSAGQTHTTSQTITTLTAAGYGMGGYGLGGYGT